MQRTAWCPLSPEHIHILLALSSVFHFALNSFFFLVLFFRNSPGLPSPLLLLFSYPLMYPLPLLNNFFILFFHPHPLSLSGSVSEGPLKGELLWAVQWAVGWPCSESSTEERQKIVSVLVEVESFLFKVKFLKWMFKEKRFCRG